MKPSADVVNQIADPRNAATVARFQLVESTCQYVQLEISVHPSEQQTTSSKAVATGRCLKQDHIQLAVQTLKVATRGKEIQPESWEWRKA